MADMAMAVQFFFKFMKLATTTSVEMAHNLHTKMLERQRPRNEATYCFKVMKPLKWNLALDSFGQEVCNGCPRALTRQTVYHHGASLSEVQHRSYSMTKKHMTKELGQESLL